MTDHRDEFPYHSLHARGNLWRFFYLLGTRTFFKCRVFSNVLGHVNLMALLCVIDPVKIRLGKVVT